MNSLGSPFLPRFAQPKVSLIQKSPSTTSNFIIFANHNNHPKESLVKKLISNTNKMRKLLLASTFKSIDDFICDYMDLPLRPSIDPKHVLSTNFAPVDELPPTVCDVAEGSIPSCLDGVYLLNGPNPQYEPRGPYHIFDGDGMLHMVKIRGAKVTYCSRYVRTYKYTLEHDMGYPVIPSPFSSFNGVLASLARVALTLARVVAGEFDPGTNGFGTANISVAVIGGKLYALCESDLPYEIKVTSDGDITTLGRHNFHNNDDQEFFVSMTAHPKIDLETGEAFAFRYNTSPPRLTYFRIDSQGRKQPDVPIFSMKNTPLMHDFAVTKKYAIFSDVQMVISPFEMLKGKPPIRVDLSKTPRLGFIEKYAKDESKMWWVDIPGFNMLHAVNAWEEDDGDTVVVVATNLSIIEQGFERLDLAGLTIEKIKISLKAKKVLMRSSLSPRLLDMATINPAYVGKKNKYAYASVVVAQPWMNIGVVKIDLSLSSSDGCNDCVVASRVLGPGCTSNETFFVAREPENPCADEDDGFIVTYVHDTVGTQESRFVVMDAKSPTLETVAAVKLPARVPCCFHGLFISQTQLSKL